MDQRRHRHEDGVTAAVLFEPDVWPAGGRRRVRMMLSMRIERWDVRRDGPLTEAALEQKVASLGEDMTARLYAPGAAAAQTDTRERVLAVARGLLKVTLDGESAILGAGDLVFVPSGAMRRTEAIGSDAAFCFEANCRPTAA